MKRLGLIIYREWITRVRRRAFIIGTLLVPVLLAFGVGFGVWMENAEMEHNKVLVVDLSGMITYWDDARQVWLPICPDCFPEREHVEYRFRESPLSDEAFLESDFTAMVLLDDGILQHGQAKNLYDKSPSISAQNAMERDLSSAIERFKVKEELALDYEAYKRLKTKVSLVGEDIVTKDGNATGRSIIGFIFSLFMFVQIMVYGMHVMRGVIEEKANRIVEVIISVVKPMELLAGKIIGIGLVGVTQVVALSLLGFLVFQVGGQALEMSGLLTSASNEAVDLDLETWMASNDLLAFILDVNWPLMIASAVVYFIAGFFMYAALFAAIGSAVEQESDAQYLMLPAMLPLLASYVTAAMAIENPEGQVAVIGSYVPLTAPILMLIRLPLGVAWWELLLSMSGVIVTAYAFVKLSARIFRTGILMHGKKVSARELFRWMRHE
jgi:ABC-2 type transport system permease protein